MSIKQLVNSAHTMALTYIISLSLITSLSIFVYFSLDKIFSEPNYSANSVSVNEIHTTQQILLTIIILSVLVNALIFIRTVMTKPVKNSEGAKQVNHDYLTNLLNRRSFNVLAEQAVAISKRYNSDLSVISFDIDHFKSINEQYGQGLGDKVIQNVANTIQTSCRDSDSVFRFDGEAFLLLLPQTSLTEAAKLAEKIRNKIASAPTFSDKLIIEITASAGVSQWHKEEINLEKALKRADKGLERAKEQGRDRIVSNS